jgi:hypothetical protein
VVELEPARLSRSDRVVYAVAVAFVLLAAIAAFWAPPGRAAPGRVRPDPAQTLVAKPPPPSPVERFGATLLMGSGIALVILWELGRWFRLRVAAAVAECTDPEAESANPRVAALAVVVFLVVLPAGLPFALLAVWLADVVTAGAPEHPMLPQGMPLRVGVFATTYVFFAGAVAAWLAALARRRRETTT